MLEIKETNIEEILKVHKNVNEFFETPCEKSVFESRYKDKKHLLLTAYLDNTPIGYMISYEQDNTFYVWMAGVDNNYRHKGALTGLMNYQIDWCKKNNYKKITIKTRNSRREMLSFLVKLDFNFVKVEAKNNNVRDNRICLEKAL